jgi:hypothetical protein
VKSAPNSASHVPAFKKFWAKGEKISAVRKPPRDHPDMERISDPAGLFANRKRLVGPFRSGHSKAARQSLPSQQS